MVTQAPTSDTNDKADQFIEGVKAGTTPPITEPLTPEIATAVEAKMDSLDEANRAKIRAALDALKARSRSPETNEGSISSLFEGAQSDLMKGAPKLLDAIIDPQLDTWKTANRERLTGEQRMNIKLAIIDRIVSGGASQALFGTLKGKLDSISQKFSSLNLENLSLENADVLAKEFSFSETSDGKKGDTAEGGMEWTMKRQIEKVLAETLGQIRGGYEARPQPARFTDLLEHPKALADYKSGEDIGALLARSGNATITRVAYREGIKKKILSLESSIFKAEETKDKVMEFLTKLPDFATGKIFATFEWLFKLPLIGDLIAAFFGYQSGTNLIEDLKIETKDRKSLQKLFEYGIGKDEKRKIKKGSENGKIKLLEDIDFSNVSYKQIRPFYKILRTNRIDPNVDGFWGVVFGEGKIETGEGDKKKTIFFPKWDAKEDTTAEKIIKKLSDQTKLETPVVDPARLNVPAIGVPAAGATLPSGTDGPVAQSQSAGTTPPLQGEAHVPATNGVPAGVATGSGAQKEGSVPAVSRGTQKSAEASTVIPEFPKALETAFLSATSFPFTFTHKDGTETISSSGNTLVIGNRKYTIEGVGGVILGNEIKLGADYISMDGKSVTLKFPTQDPKASPKEKFIPILNEILIYTAGEQRRKEVKDETTGRFNTLIITRTA